MFDEGSPPPVTPSRKRITRMRTGGRKPLASSSDRFLDLEAAESGESADEDNLDKYESDFIDDGNDDDRDTSFTEALISWSRTPSPTPERPPIKATAVAGTAASSKRTEPAKQDVGLQSHIAPMTTRSRAKNIPAAAVVPQVAVKPGSAHNLNTTGYKGSRADTNRKLEAVRKPPMSIVVNMDSAEHEEFMLFKNTRIASVKPAGDKIENFRPAGDSSSSSSITMSAGTLLGTNKVANLPAPTWSLTGHSHESNARELDSVAHEDLAAQDTPPSGELRATALDKTVSKTAGKKPVNRGSKRKRLEVQEIATDESGQSEPETSVVAGSSLRKHKDDVAVTAGKSNKRTLVSTGDSGRGILPKVPTAEFDRLKEASPAKKPKKEETVLHTVDVKSVQELPATCEVMDVELQVPMMKPIYALDLPKLKYVFELVGTDLHSFLFQRGQVTTWSSNEGSGMFMLSHYPVINPKLSIATVWALLLFTQKGHYINPARIDPRLLEARSPVYARDGPRKRWVLSVNARPAVCVSVVNVVQSSVQQISTVYGASNSATPLLKFITGVHLSQDFDRVTGLCGMVFDLSLMHVQLNMSALTFGTRGISIDKYEKLGSPEQKGIKSSSSLYRKQTYTAPTDSLNYDDKIVRSGFDASVDIDNLARILPLYTGEIPTNSCTAVAYTVSNFVKHAPGRDDEQHLSFNLQWVVVLGEPE
ncbi:hypothetical protein B0H14DRAFT_3646334 [Mycena olivaceomarginata]|nr:hypothetical protein B0H14DRAFT_3646334 [Mycena olivaceomarginata]